MELWVKNYSLERMEKKDEWKKYQFVFCADPEYRQEFQNGEPWMKTRKIFINQTIKQSLVQINGIISIQFPKVPLTAPHLRHSLVLMWSSILSSRSRLFYLFYFIWDIYHPYRKVMNQNVLQGSAPYKIEQRPFTVKLNWKKCLKFHSNIVYQIEQMSF